MKVLLVYDIPGWAWERKANAIQSVLRYHVEKIRTMDMKRFLKEPDRIVRAFDSIHLFGWRYMLKWAQFASTTVASYDFGNPKKIGDAKKILPQYRGIVGACQDLAKLVERQVGVKVWCLPNGVNHTQFRPPAKPRANKNLVVGWVGKPMWKVDKSRFESEFQYMGEGGIWPILKSRLLGIEGIETRQVANMPGEAIPADKMVEFYQGIDVFICPHHQCGTPNPLMEAAACGCCVVSTPCGVAPQIIDHERTGMMLSGYEVGGVECVIDRFVDTVKLLSTNKDWVERCGEAVRETIEDNWTWRQRAKAWLPMFEKTRYK